MHSLAIDLETFSSVDIAKCGVHKYVESDDFEIMLFAYKVDDHPVKLIDLMNMEDIPQQIIDAILDVNVHKTAYNAAFEIACLTKHIGKSLPLQNWTCTMAKAAMLGLPFGLGKVAEVLNLSVQKDFRGATLIRKFCVPCKPTKANGERIRNYPHHFPQDWEDFKTYAIKDVIVEQQIKDKISFYEIPAFEIEMWILDQQINQRGIRIDQQLVRNAISMNQEHSETLAKELFALSGIRKATEMAKLKTWLSAEIDEEVGTLSKDTLPALLERIDSDKAKRVLEIRQQASKTSIKKYQAMMNYVCKDGRVRGLFQYYGANRTGRWAGRGIQMQNLTKNFIKDIDLARDMVLHGDLEDIKLFFGNVSSILSQLIRTAFIPAEGKKLVVSDFSAIEARVLAWLAGEDWRLEVFNTHGKIYEASASAMFNKPLESIKKGSTERDAGKVAELALGYQGGVGAMTMMIQNEKRKAIEQGKTFDYSPTDDEKQLVVDRYRAANPNIVNFWYALNDAVITCVKERRTVHIDISGISFYMERGILFMRLPSGRSLAYMRPRIEQNKFGRDCVSYEGMNQTTKQWTRTQLYGGLLAENATQAVSRDVLAYKMIDINNYGNPFTHKGSFIDEPNLFNLIAHIHDEDISETYDDWDNAIEILNSIMSEPLQWAPGLPLKGDSFETYYYKKED